MTITLKMPGVSYAGQLLPLTEQEESLKKNLFSHIEHLSIKIGERNIRRYTNLEKTAEYISDSLKSSGYDVKYQEYNVSEKPVRNIEASLIGSKKPDEIIIIGAHYDSVDSPAANDNGSGVAALLELARLLKDSNPAITIRFVAFVNEEQPFFQTRNMGSFVYAKRSHERGENIIGMLSLETIGYYSSEAKSQLYPFPLNYFYPDIGNFIGFVGNGKSKELVQKAVTLFREHAHFPSEGAAITEYVSGVGRSDQWSFWQFGYPALMVTDTAPYRYPFYHTEEDTIDKLDFTSMTHVVSGLEKMINKIARKFEAKMSL